MLFVVDLNFLVGYAEAKMVNINVHNLAMIQIQILFLKIFYLTKILIIKFLHFVHRRTKETVVLQTVTAQI